MAILVDKNTRVAVQGITGNYGSFHARLMMEYGTKVVAGVTPGKGGTMFEKTVPIFDTVQAAAQEAGADASIIFVRADFALDAILEAAEAGIRLVVVVTEGIPVMDMVRARAALDRKGVRMIGPNCPGIITAGECKIGIMPGYIHVPGKVGVISRSGTLTYEAVYQLTQLGLGQTTCIGIGGDPVGGVDFVDCLSLFNEDPATEAVLMIGEIGGSAEEKAAAFVREHMKKPVAAFIAGLTAPAEKRMGHAGAIISGGKGTAKDKIEALRAAGVAVAESPAVMGETMKRAMQEKGRAR
jgi:succinyl-CoA synthetase alpha subunit